MRLRSWFLGWAAIVCWAGTNEAGIIDRFKPKPPAKPAAPTRPTDRAGELVQVLRNDPDERRRLAAIIELSKADLRQAPQAGEALIEALRFDANVAIRTAAATALGRLRPLTISAAQALDEAFQSDASPRVRTAAKAALTPYLQAGYRAPSAPPIPASTPRTSVPLAKKAGTPPGPTIAPHTGIPPRQPMSRITILQPSTDEPPLADSRPQEPTQEANPASTQRSSVVPLRSPLNSPAPSKPEIVEPKPIKPEPRKPTKPTDDEGPILIGPG